MYAINASALRQAARAKGYRGLAPVLEKLGLHRNVLNRYIAGAPVLPESLSRIVEELGLRLEEAVVRTDPFREIVSPDVLELVDSLSVSYPECSFFLFGSRASGRARKYSDFDLGVYRTPSLEWKDYLKMIAAKEQFEERSPYRIDLVNLNRADKPFLVSIGRDLRLLAGRYSDQLALERRAVDDGN